MTYPKVTEIKRQEWEPEQIAPSEAEACRNESVRKAHGVQQARIQEWRNNPKAGKGGQFHSAAHYNNSIPTVCPKR